MTTTEAGSALATRNPEDDPDAVLNALVATSPPPKPGAQLMIQRSSEMQKLDNLMRYATIFAAAGHFKGLTSGDVKRQAALCAVKIIAGDELGISPMASMRSIHVFDGNVELAGSLIMSLVNRYQKNPAPSGMYYKARILERTELVCKIACFSREEVTDEWELLEEVTWTVDDSRRAGLLEKDNHKRYPRAMNFNRCASEAGRVHFAECFGGGPIYGAGEISNADVDADGNFLQAFDAATTRAANAIANFDQEILDLADDVGWTPAFLQAQAIRLNDRTRLIDLLNKTKERMNNSSRGHAQNGTDPKAPVKEKPAPPEYDATAGSITEETRKHLFGALSRRNIKTPEDRHDWCKKHKIDIAGKKGRPEQTKASFKNLSEAEAQRALNMLVIAIELGDGAVEWADRCILDHCDACGAKRTFAHKTGCLIDETDEPAERLI